ncbi:MAG: DUF3108 domain-containing protein [Burkholderiales bacterium]|nr:DUF3108 domain-containing protein [Burkholderiales bacterium]
MVSSSTWWQHCPMRALPSHLPARPASAARWGAVLAGVLVVHGWLLGHWAAPRPGASAARAAPSTALQLRAITALPSIAAQAAPVAVPAVVATTPALVKPRAVVTPPPLAAATDLPPPVGAPGLDNNSAPTPPPIYPTRLPAPTTLAYSVRTRDAQGEARLRWQHDGERYELTLDARNLAERALIEQRSAGALDDTGLAPDRFTDRRFGRRTLAANFERDSGRVRFSGVQRELTSWPGTQDRLGWVAQLAAIASAAAPAVPDEITLEVVGSRGGGGRWVFRRIGDETIATPLGELATIHLQRRPDRAEDLAVDVWLDPARGHWPARLDYVAPRMGRVLELTLAAEPGPP